MTSTKSSCGSADERAEVVAGAGVGSGAAAAEPAKAAGSGSMAAAVEPAKAADGSRAARDGAHGRMLRHDFWVVLRQLLPLLAVGLAVYAIAMPVATAAIPGSSIMNLDYTHDQLKFRFWLDELTPFVVLFSAGFGLVLGLRAFRFLLVKREATAVLSLPLSRTALFGTRLGASLLVLLVAIGVPLAASLVVNLAALGVWDGVFEQCAYVLCGLFLTGAAACAIGCIGCALAGTLAEATALSVALLAAVSVAAWGGNAVMDWLLVGNAFGEYLYNGSEPVAPGLLELTAAANPLLFFLEPAAEHQVFIVQHPVYFPEVGNWGLLAGWLVACAVLGAVGCACVRRRPGERAGIAGLSVVASAVVGLVSGVAAFGLTFTVVAPLNVAAAVVCAFGVFWAVSAALFAGPLRGRGGRKRTLALVGAESGVLAVVLVVLATGGLGYAGAVPAAADVSSVGVSYVGNPSFLGARFDTAKASDGGFYVSAEQTYQSAEAVELVRQVHEQLIASGAEAIGPVRGDFAGTVMPYDVVVRYQLADGGQMVRYYDRATLGELAELAALSGTQEGSELMRAVIAGDTSLLAEQAATELGASAARTAFALGDIYLSDRLYAAPVLVNCDGAARAELLAALADDVAAQPVADRDYPDSPCLGVLMFTQAGETAAASFAYSLENAVVYLTDAFPRTLAWLEANGLTGYLALPDESAVVESVMVQHYAPFDGMNAVTEPSSAYFMGYRSDVGTQFLSMQDFGTRFVAEEPEQVAELLALARNEGCLDGGGYLLSCKLAGGGYSYLLVPEADAPEWLVRVAG